VKGSTESVGSNGLKAGGGFTGRCSEDDAAGNCLSQHAGDMSFSRSGSTRDKRDGMRKSELDSILLF
jgi:hypothetical protein